MEYVVYCDSGPAPVEVAGLRGFVVSCHKARFGGEGCMTKGTEHRYIVRDDGILCGEPIVTRTRTPVRAIVELWRLGVTPEEIPTHLPHLTLAQVFDALSYYADHQAEIEAFIARNQVPDDLTHPKSRVDA